VENPDTCKVRRVFGGKSPRGKPPGQNLRAGDKQRQKRPGRGKKVKGRRLDRFKNAVKRHVKSAGREEINFDGWGGGQREKNRNIRGKKQPSWGNGCLGNRRKVP